MPVLINAHVSMWERQLGDIEEEVCPIPSRMSRGSLSISRRIECTILLVESLAIRTIPCGCGDLQKLVDVKWEFDGSQF